MPWWWTLAVVDEMDPAKFVKIFTMVDTGKMVLSYDNLITRLWNTALERLGVTVFDFTLILAVTEQRVEYDLLGADPISIPDLQHKLKRLAQQQQSSSKSSNVTIANAMEDNTDGPVMKDSAPSPTKPRHHLLGSVMESTNGFLSKNHPIWNPFQKQKDAPCAASNSETTSAVPGRSAEASSIETEPISLGTPDLPSGVMDLLDADAPLSSWWGNHWPGTKNHNNKDETSKL